MKKSGPDDYEAADAIQWLCFGSKDVVMRLHLHHLVNVQRFVYTMRITPQRMTNTKMTLIMSMEDFDESTEN